VRLRELELHAGHVRSARDEAVRQVPERRDASGVRDAAGVVQEEGIEPAAVVDRIVHRGDERDDRAALGEPACGQRSELRIGVDQEDLGALVHAKRGGLETGERVGDVGSHTTHDGRGARTRGSACFD
jgi:hypothetical protein